MKYFLVLNSNNSYFPLIYFPFISFSLIMVYKFLFILTVQVVQFLIYVPAQDITNLYAEQ